MRLGAALLKAKNSRSNCILIDEGEGEYSVMPLPEKTAYFFRAGYSMPSPVDSSRETELREMFKSAMAGKLAPVPGKTIKRRKVK